MARLKLIPHRNTFTALLLNLVIIELMLMNCVICKPHLRQKHKLNETSNANIDTPNLTKSIEQINAATSLQMNPNLISERNQARKHRSSVKCKRCRYVSREENVDLFTDYDEQLVTVKQPRTRDKSSHSAYQFRKLFSKLKFEKINKILKFLQHTATKST